MGSLPACLWSVHTGSVTDEDWSAYVGRIGDAPEEYRAGACILTVVVRGQRPSAVQRRQLADVIETVPEGLFAHAFVTDSAAIRGVLTALQWLIRKPYVEKSFVRVPPALHWAKETVRGLDPDAVVAALTAEVPASMLEPVLAREARGVS